MGDMTNATDSRFTPQEAAAWHDEILCELLAAFQDAARKMGYARDTASRHLGYDPRRNPFYGSNNQLGAELEEWRNEDPDAWIMSYSMNRTTAVARYDEAHDALRAARAELDDHEKNYTGWVRFFLLTSSDGHVHRSMNCSTCNKGRSASTFALMPSISGTSFESAVAVLGATLCSVCFPEAPVSYLDAERIPASLAAVLYEKGEEAFVAARAAHAEKAAARAAAKCPGSGARVTVPANAYRPHATCPSCGSRFSAKGGKLAAHKVPK